MLGPTGAHCGDGNAGALLALAVAIGAGFDPKPNFCQRAVPIPSTAPKATAAEMRNHFVDSGRTDGSLGMAGAARGAGRRGWARAGAPVARAFGSCVGGS